MGKVDDDISELESKRDFDGLLKHLSSKSGRARGLAANALGKLGDPSYLPHLEKMLLQEDNSRNTIECAKWAIADLKLPPATRAARSKQRTQSARRKEEAERRKEEDDARRKEVKAARRTARRKMEAADREKLEQQIAEEGDELDSFTYKSRESSKRFPTNTLLIGVYKWAAIGAVVFGVLGGVILSGGVFGLVIIVIGVVIGINMLLVSEMIKFLMDFHDANYINTKVRIKTLEALQEISKKLKK